MENNTLQLQEKRVGSVSILMTWKIIHCNYRKRCWVCFNFNDMENNTLQLQEKRVGSVSILMTWKIIHCNCSKNALGVFQF